MTNIYLFSFGIQELKMNKPVLPVCENKHSISTLQWQTS